MKRQLLAIGMAIVWMCPVSKAHAKSKRICVDVHIRTARSLLRKKKRSKVNKTPAPVKPSARPTPAPAKPAPRRVTPPRRESVTGPNAPVTPTARPSGPVAPRLSLAQRRRNRRKVFRRGYRAGVRRTDRRWQVYLRGRHKKRYPYPPAAYLRRLVEHFVTHAKGYLAVVDRCEERIILEMYPIKGGWTVFARSSKRAREEKVDLVTYEELSRFAERVVTALLKGQHIAATANLRTILQADSMREYRTIKGSHHFTMTLGSAFKVGYLPTFHPSGLRNQVRALAPMTFSIGYRGRFNAWGIDAYMRGGVGLQRESALRNTEGGHVDLDGLWSLGLQFLRYTSPHGMNSFYYGGGALFDLTVFTAIKPEAERNKYDRVRLTGGGLNLTFVVGMEFMRASAAQFFLQLVISAPVYPFELGTRTAAIKAYIPEVAATAGIMF